MNPAPKPGTFWLAPAGEAGTPLGRLTLAGRAVRTTRPMAGRPWRYLGSYALALILDGEGDYVDEEGVIQKLGSGDLITVWPTRGHRYSPRRSGWTESFLVFSGPVFDLWNDCGMLDPARPVVSLGSTEPWRERFAWVVDGNEKASPSDPLSQVMRLQLLLAEIHAALHPDATPATARETPPWIDRAVKALSSDPESPLDLESLAVKCHVSYTTFRRRLTQHLGMPPARFRATQLIDHARRLVLRTDLSDKQIAYRLGFTDPHHFSHRFKQLAGQTPTQYRQSVHR